MEILFSFAVILVAVYVLIWTGKRVVRSISAIARFLRVSEYVLSFVLLAFATSLPELSVGISSAIAGTPEISFGDVMGTNIVNFTLILGTVAIFGGAIKLKDYDHFKSNRIFELSVVLAPLVLILDGKLSRIDGVILLALFIWNMFRLLDIDDKILGRKVLRPHLSSDVHSTIDSRSEFVKTIFIFAASIAILFISTMVIVFSAQNISTAIGIPHVLIGILIIAVATSLPDLAIDLRSVRRKRGGIALGDIFGTTALNSTLTLGIVSLVSPIVLHELNVVWIGIGFTLTAFLFTFFFLSSKDSISRKEGIALVTLYIFFVATQISIGAF